MTWKCTYARTEPKRSNGAMSADSRKKGGEETHEANPVCINESVSLIEDNMILVPVCIYGFGGKVFTSYVGEVTFDSCRVIRRTEWNVVNESKRKICTYVLREWRVRSKGYCGLLFIESAGDGQLAAFSLDLPRGGSGGEVRPLARRCCVPIHVEVGYSIALRSTGGRFIY